VFQKHKRLLTLVVSGLWLVLAVPAKASAKRELVFQKHKRPAAAALLARG